MMVCSTTTRLSVSDMRPPYSAFASIGSTARRGAHMRDGKPDQAQRQAAERRHQDGAIRVQLDHRAEPLRAAMPNSSLVDQLGGLGHHPDQEAGAAADEGGQRHQPDLVGANQRAQRLRRVQHCFAQRAAMAMHGGAVTRLREAVTALPASGLAARARDG